LQAKILRAVQEREIERVGGGETIPVDVRLIAATNRDLKEAIKQGRFREDLYYRLAVVTIRLPTLVERGDDLVLLTAYYVRLLAHTNGQIGAAAEILGIHRNTLTRKMKEYGL